MKILAFWIFALAFSLSVIYGAGWLGVHAVKALDAVIR